MNFFDWLAGKFGKKKIPLSGSFAPEGFAADLCGAGVEALAFWSCVNFIANALSKCEFKTYVNNEEVREKEYYLWNVSPNQNQNSSTFVHKWIEMLYSKNECLIISQNDKLYVADSYIRTQYTLYDVVFSEVTIDGFTINRSFIQSEVLFFNFQNGGMKRILDTVYAEYEKILLYSMKSYQKSHGTKGIYKYETIPANPEDQQKQLDYIAERMKKWFTADSAALPLGTGEEWVELAHKTYSSENTRDIKAIINDVTDFYARGFGIPSVLILGDVAGAADAVERFLSFCMDPLAVFLSNEINRKRNGYDGVKSGTRLEIDTSNIRHIDLLSVASPVDKLVSSGAFSINEIRKILKQPAVGEPWADEHFITKNYMPVDDLTRLAEGGAQNE